jgi:hypothetical protein
MMRKHIHEQSIFDILLSYYKIWQKWVSSWSNKWGIKISIINRRN